MPLLLDLLARLDLLAFVIFVILVLLLLVMILHVEPTKVVTFGKHLEAAALEVATWLEVFLVFVVFVDPADTHKSKMSYERHDFSRLL